MGLCSATLANKFKTHCLPGNCQPIAPFTWLFHRILLCLSICVQVPLWSWGGADGVIPFRGVEYRIHWARWGQTAAGGRVIDGEVDVCIVVKVSTVRSGSFGGKSGTSLGLGVGRNVRLRQGMRSSADKIRERWVEK